jgi:hypothetical protein
VTAGKLRQVITTEMKHIYLAKANQKNQVLLDQCKRPVSSALFGFGGWD